MPKISIILPTYNRSSIIENTIISVIRQSFTDWELLIIDDCSQDLTYDILASYIHEHENIIYYRNEKNLGLPKSRNKGIALAKSQYIFFIEDDLVLHTDCVHFLYTTIIDSDWGKKIGGVSPRLIEKDLPVIHPKKPFVINSLTGEISLNYTINPLDVIKCESAHACTLYKQNLLNSIGGYKENRYKGSYAYEDVDLNRRIFKKGYSLLFQPKAYAYHNKINQGGCRIQSSNKEKYYYYRNYVIYIVCNYGIMSPFMIVGKCALDMKQCMKGIWSRIER